MFSALKVFSIYAMFCILDETHEWQEKIRGTKKLVIGFAQEEIKCKIKEDEAKKWKENMEWSAHIFWLMYYLYFFYIEITPVTTAA